MTTTSGASLSFDEDFIHRLFDCKNAYPPGGKRKRKRKKNNEYLCVPTEAPEGACCPFNPSSSCYSLNGPKPLSRASIPFQPNYANTIYPR